MKEVCLISLCGSRILPDEVDSRFLSEFKKLIDSHLDKKFVVVCGGGKTARKYMSALKKLGRKNREQSLEGIAITRLHAGFMSRFFGEEANENIPINMRSVKRLLKKNRVVFCGGLRYRDKNTSDGTAAKVAGFLGCSFINLTNVKGLYDRDPKTPLDSKHLTGQGKARLISKISWKEFLKVAKKLKYEAGQHFVLDLVAAEEILEKRVVTYIVGSLKSVDNILKGKKFVGTVIGR